MMALTVVIGGRLNPDEDKTMQPCTEIKTPSNHACLPSRCSASHSQLQSRDLLAAASPRICRDSHDDL
ncbi:hypothetical protein PAXRUDRAFT_832686 [Paxillus rubicundulus Ve08.2h10]|uniref:Uncharacterized protein n=1 Tax=Paxillus rubicundulus Ve08.2h10 TaxID=930991 RepID=A0A0D0DQK7_9AGAM|nr:hypothetical protein PAXRUDRAFT_832686 [Paxillus rubicundulus Ve08.2h10]